MSTTRRFHIGDILSVTTGRLLSPEGMAGIYSVLSYMTGEAVYTHQIPRVIEECRPELLRQFPQLAQVETPTNLTGEVRVVSWVAGMAAQFGEWFEVARMAGDDHAVIDPVAELEGMVGAERVIVVYPGE